MFKIFFRFILSALFIGSCMNAKAQYFYKDIWNGGQSNKEMANLKAGNIRTVSIKSFNSDGEPDADFFCEERINKAYSFSETITRSDVTSQSILSSNFNAKGLITRTADSTESSLNITEYLYNDNNQVIAARSFTRAYDDPVTITETHDYIYSSAGLQKMIRKKNDIEISAVNFKTDEKGNVIEEQEILKNGSTKKYFYYYDDKNNLTDVVHFNERAKRLLPDYMYEYNIARQIKQMITTEEGGGYFIWKYTYNDQQLRETEKCFSKERKLLGSVQYTYK